MDLNDDLHDKIKGLCAGGDELAQEAQYDAAIRLYEQALGRSSAAAHTSWAYRPNW